LRNANGSFTKVLFPRPAGALAHAAGVPAIGDINGDGLADVVMLYTPAWPSTDRYRKPIMQVLLQTVAGQWVDATNELLVPYSNFDWSDSYCTKAYLSDINGDGRRDLILEVSEKKWLDRRAWIRIFENTNGKLIEKELFLGQDQSRIHVVDIDNNGKDDILINQKFSLKILIQN
jgi:hypothetical protein